MARYIDKDHWEEEIVIPNTNTPILGGQPVWEGDRLVDGFANIPPAILADRTRHLKNKVESIEYAIGEDFQNVLRKEENLADLEDIQQAKYNLDLNLVDNTRDMDKPVSVPQQEALDTKVDKIPGKGLSTEDYTTAEKNKLAGVQSGAQVNTVTSVAGRVGAVVLSKNDVGLNNVDNTSDENKPISTATQTALNGKVDLTDPRLTNSREWTASTVSQAEAEAGTATTARKWTAQRVRQAIVAWWNSTGLQSTIEGKANSSVTLTAGNGLTGGGDLSANRSFVLGTPSTITGSTTNSVTATSHTHAISVAVGDVSGLTTALNNKVDKVAGMGLSQENYTTAEKNKLASLESSRFKGEFVSLSALEAAFPTTEVGSFAYVDQGVGEDVVKYIWDSSDQRWVLQQGESAALTPSDVKSLYESNPDTNAFTDLEKSKLGNAVVDSDPRLTNAREWTANTVSQAEAEAGTATTARKWTAQRVRQAILGWWNNASTVFGRDFVGANTASDARNLLELGSAATADLGTGASSAARGNHTHTQYWDITSSTHYAPAKDLNDYVAGEGGYTRSSDANSPGTGYNLVTLQGYGTSDRTQLALPQRGVQDIKYRSRNTNGTWEPWSTVWSTFNFNPDTKLDATANAVSATRLNTARTINGTSFNGTANITTSSWGTARNITIGSTAKSVNGSGNVSWSLAEIGAAPTVHTHTASQISDSTAVGRSVLTAADAAAARTAIGAGTSNLSIGTTSSTAKAGNWQPSTATKAQVLNGTANSFVSGVSYHNVITWAAATHSSGTVTLNLDTSLNHDLTVGGNITMASPSNADAGKTGDIVIQMTANGTVSWNTNWKFLGSVPDIGESGDVWVISYKVLNSSFIIAAASKVAS